MRNGFDCKRERRNKARSRARTLSANGLHDQNPLVRSFEGTMKIQTGIKCWCASYVYPHLNAGQQLLEV